MSKKIKEILSLFVASSIIFGSYVPQICAKEEDIDSLNVNSANDSWEVQIEDENQGENSENYAETNSQLIVKYIDGDGERINDENAVYINHEYDAVVLSEGSDVNEYMEQAKEANDNIDYIQIDYQLRLFDVDETAVFDDEKEDSPDEVLSISEDGQDESIIEDESEGSIMIREESDLENTPSSDVDSETVMQDDMIIEKAVEDEGDTQSDIEVSENSDMTVAVIDSGVYVEHEALSGKMWINSNEIEDLSDDDGNGYIDDINGWDFSEDKPLLYEESRIVDYNHGTHVAGIIASVSSGAKIMPLKAFKDGSAYTSDVIKAIDYAENMGADVVNCSFGSDNENQALRDVIENSEMTFVCAAGNNAKDIDQSPVYPASYDLDNVISVAATDSNNNLAYFSNYGNSIDVAASGLSIYSSLAENEYGNMSGTSMAAAYISGIVTNIVISEQNTSTELIKEQLLLSADSEIDINNGGNFIKAFNNSASTISDYETQTADQYSLGINSIEDISPITQIAAGGYHSVIMADGAVYPFGDNTHNQCSGMYYFGEGSFPAPGNKLFVLTNNPEATAKTSVVKKVSTKGDHTLLLMADGTVRAMGANAYGQLGIGYVGGENITDAYEPTEQVVGLSNIVDISAGHQFSMALDSSGRVYTWGNNKDGQIGIPSTYAFFYAPQYVSTLKNVKSISAGYYHALAQTTSNEVYGWGRGYNGALGALSNDRQFTPKSLNIEDVDKIVAGLDNSFFIKNDNTVYAYGYNYYGQLGDGTSDVQRELKQIPIDNVADISTGFSTVFLKEDGTAYGCGLNAYGELGIGTISNVVKSITQIPGTYEAVSVGGSHTLFLSNGELYAAGRNHKNQCGFESTDVCYTEPTWIPVFSKTAFTIDDIILDYDNDKLIIMGDCLLGETSISGYVGGVHLYADVIPENNQYELEFQLSKFNKGDSYGELEVDGYPYKVDIGFNYEDSQKEMTDSFTKDIINGSMYLIAIDVLGIQDIQNKIFTVDFDKAKLAVDDICAQTWLKDISVGYVQDTDIEIISATDSQIKFKIKRSQSPLSGTINMIRFRAVSNGSATITVTATAE